MSSLESDVIEGRSQENREIKTSRKSRKSLAAKNKALEEPVKILEGMVFIQY